MVERINLKVFVQKLHQTLENLIQRNGDFISDEITRRAFVNNAFDGALTILGILMGNIILGTTDPRIVISTGLSACLAMGMSGAFGRYLSERAERKRTLRQMEQYMFTDLSGSILERESEKKVLVISLIDGLSPALAAVIPLIPFFLAQSVLISVEIGVIASFILDFFVLFILGVFLGRVSGENVLLHGMLVVAVGFITSLIIFLSAIFFSVS
jgi:predicted membrane protein (TIGR00267 family)